MEIEAGGIQDLGGVKELICGGALNLAGHADHVYGDNLLIIQRPCGVEQHRVGNDGQHRIPHLRHVHQ